MGAGFVRICTDSNFERDVLASGRPVLLAFGTSWCGPCRLMAPALRALAATEKDRLTVAKLDVDANPETADRYAVERFPVCILFRDGKEIERLDGYMPLRKIEMILAPHLAIA
jgi:thioredoxin 1